MVTRVRHSTKALPVNDTAFIDGSEKAEYFLGFLLCDSGTNKTTGQVKLELTEKDGSIVEQLRDYVVPGRVVSHTPERVNPINGSTTKPTMYINLPRIPFSQALQNFGVYGMKPFRRLHVSLRHSNHAWRGAVDADGSLSHGKNGRPTLSLQGSLPVLLDFKNFVGVHHKVAQAGNIYQIHITGPSVIQVVDLLYSNSTIHLHRKYAIAQAWMEGRVYWNGENWV